MKKLTAFLLSAAIFGGTCATANDFYRGGDISSLTYIEDLGGKYYDSNGVERDALEILSENGMNMARIRLSNNPGKGRGDGTYYLREGYQDEADCLNLAKRAKDAGMDIQFTFNYSDYWSNGSRQIVPSDWVNQIKTDLGYDISDPTFLKSMAAAQRTQIISALETIVYNYTFDIMSKLREQDTVPKYVSLGNEINGGLLFPFANTYSANMSSSNFELVFGSDTSSDDIVCPEDWASLAKFINAGYNAVKAVSPETEVIIHLADGTVTGTYTWYFDALAKAGAKYDVIGASYYPAWTNSTIETCVSFCNTLTSRYNKDIMIMETGYNWNEVTTDGYPGQLTSDTVYKDIYPSTQEGHYGYMRALFAGLRSVKDNRCAGVLYWDPLMIHVEDENGNNLSGWAYSEATDKAEKNVVENTALFDFNGKAILSLNAFREDMLSHTNPQNPTHNKHYRISEITEENSVIKPHITASRDAEKALAIIAQYDENGRLIDVNVGNISPDNTDFTAKRLPRASFAKCFVWNEKSEMLSDHMKF